MARSISHLQPRISLGVTYVKQSLEELLTDLAEPIVITLEGRRVAVLVPYDQYLQMAAALSEEKPAPAEENG